MKDTQVLLRNKKQIDEALSDVNRYYFWEKYGRQPIDDSELVEYYIFSGGAVNFAGRWDKSQKQAGGA